MWLAYLVVLRGGGGEGVFLWCIIGTFNFVWNVKCQFNFVWSVIMTFQCETWFASFYFLWNAISFFYNIYLVWSMNNVRVLNSHENLTRHLSQYTIRDCAVIVINNLVSVDRRYCDLIDFSVTNYMFSYHEWNREWLVPILCLCESSKLSLLLRPRNRYSHESWLYHAVKSWFVTYHEV